MISISMIMLLFGVLIISLVMSYFYPAFALKYGFHAKPNFRSLHTKIMPRGVGIVIVSIMLPVIFLLRQKDFIPHNEFIVLLSGGLLVSLVGFLDDRFEISARIRFPVQIAAAVWICFWLGASPVLNLGFTTIDLGWFGAILAVVMLVWFYNLFNFIDGIDAMAMSSVVFVSFSMGIILFLEQESSLAIILFFLGIANLGVLYFNWPPAKVFLGDVGTSFNSYTLSVIIMSSLWTGKPIVWIWLILLAYYLTDTTLTTSVRIIKFRRTWYHPHRSHAYQNLARIWDNHLKMVSIVWLINLVWLLPLAILAYRMPENAWLYFMVAYFPVVVFVLKHGPLLEDQ